ncbi:Protein cornichon-like 1, partial [Cucurbita argyrosperma subsp. sororia]
MKLGNVVETGSNHDGTTEASSQYVALDSIEFKFSRTLNLRDRLTINNQALSSGISELTLRGCRNGVESDLLVRLFLYQHRTSRPQLLPALEFLVQGLFCSLFLFTGHWFMFLITVPVSCYHINLFLKREHLIDVTEVFKTLKREKYFRFAKLIFYLLLFLVVIFRLTLSAFNALSDEGDVLHLF